MNVSLRPAEGGKALLLFSGKTGPTGTADVSFACPRTPPRPDPGGRDPLHAGGRHHRAPGHAWQRDYRVLLTTDKPIYQPGQVIHLRALALSTFDLTPAAGQALEVIIADGKGNKVFRQTLTTSEFGVAWTDFQLASEVNTGDYKITAALGNTASEKTVTVEHYVLPKFKVELQDRARLLPARRARAAAPCRPITSSASRSRAAR